MLSQTKQALDAFDNQHDFERCAADILNALGYANVEPIAPGGGSDGGHDVRFLSGDQAGLAFVTLRKDIERKYTEDLAKLADDGKQVIMLFCTVQVTFAQRKKFTEQALAKGHMLEVYDLERLRSLLDSSLKDIRQRYLHIDDPVSESIRGQIVRALKYPDGVIVRSRTILEELLRDRSPIIAYEILLEFDDRDIAAVPRYGHMLKLHKERYNKFRRDVSSIEERALQDIAKHVEVGFEQGWRIYWRYALLRLAGQSADEVRNGHHFLNFDITWDDAERLYAELSGQTDSCQLTAQHLAAYNEMSIRIAEVAR